VGALLAGRLNYLCFDTGVMYRSVTLAALLRRVAVTDETAVTKLAESVKIDVLPPHFNDGRQCTVLLDGEDVTWAIRAAEVDADVSQVSAYKRVREILTAEMRAIAKRGRVVMLGRDIGTMVLPNADLKIYLDATPDERARRRHTELEGRGIVSEYEQILSSIRKRDQFDSNREHAPLKPASEAKIVDTTGMTINQVVARLLELVRVTRDS
jgi:cytidylate kinase